MEHASEHPNVDPRTPRRDWAITPEGGYAAFIAARERHLENLRRESEIFRLEEIWAAPPAK